MAREINNRPRTKSYGAELMNPHSPTPLAYSVADACRALSLGKTRIYQLINEGKLQSRKVGKRRLIPAESLRRLIAGEV
ncbi:excisionase family DNA binding protein [Novosphingobium sp. SG751A]|uniref:helix-turn-helix domain-containing protein n=1 Tax=Novosphingobium sp. SG751A TaxID=2587000 RepID=UPI0020A65F24|nr:helix-turn-helix domain-containing protein [Novosphingobium sp. SG751A]NOW44533.1 excisionase family DNA binding protein [Novosphingobium sp. SG751A]